MIVQINKGCTLSQNAASIIFGYPTGHAPGNGVGWNETEFKRTITVEELDVDKEARITATVSWGQGTPQARVITVTGNVLRWYNP